MQEAERPMLAWLHGQNCKQANAGRGFINENPWGSTLFSITDLSKNSKVRGEKQHRVDQCMHGAVNPETKTPIQKATRLSTNVPLKYSIKRCDRHRGQPHGALEGIDPKTKMPRTALAAVFPYKFVGSLLDDIQSFLMARKNSYAELSSDLLLRTGIEHNHAYWKCKACQGGKDKLGQPHTKVTGCKYGPGGPLRHNLKRLEERESKEKSASKPASDAGRAAGRGPPMERELTRLVPPATPSPASVPEDTLRRWLRPEGIWEKDAEETRLKVAAEDVSDLQLTTRGPRITEKDGKAILQILERLTKLLSNYLGKCEKKLIVLGMEYGQFMQDMSEILMVLHDQSQAYPASVAGPSLEEVAALLRMLKNIISSDYVVKAIHCGRDLDHMVELPEGVSYPLRLVAYKIQDSDDEYSWAISGFQENFDHATPSRSEWQLVIYAEENQDPQEKECLLDQIHLVRRNQSRNLRRSSRTWTSARWPQS